jgi:hypothetical protein
MGNEINMENETTETISSQDDEERRELLWNSKIENLILDWKESCLNLAQKHTVIGKYKKQVHYLLSFFCIILPFCTAFFSEILPNDILSTSKTIILFVSSCLSALNTFLNFGKAYSEHSFASFKYTELVHEIDSILVKPKADRMQADLQLEIIKNRFELLNKTCIEV